MQEKEQDYAKASFEDVAHKYDEIPFFKISAKYVVEIIQKHTQEKNLQVLDVACGTGNVVCHVHPVCLRQTLMPWIFLRVCWPKQKKMPRVKIWKI